MVKLFFNKINTSWKIAEKVSYLSSNDSKYSEKMCFKELEIDNWKRIGSGNWVSKNKTKEKDLLKQL